MCSYFPEFLSHCALKLISSFAKISRVSPEKQASGALVKGRETAQSGGSGLCCVLGGAHASSGCPGARLSPRWQEGLLSVSCDKNIQLPVHMGTFSFNWWSGFCAQSAFPPSSQLSSANALVLLGLCNYHLASNTEEWKEAKSSHMPWRLNVSLWEKFLNLILHIYLLLLGSDFGERN